MKKKKQTNRKNKSEKKRSKSKYIPPRVIKKNNKKYVFDRSGKGLVDKKALQEIGKAGVKFKAIKGYWVKKRKGDNYYLYIRP